MLDADSASLDGADLLANEMSMLNIENQDPDMERKRFFNQDNPIFDSDRTCPKLATLITELEKLNSSGKCSSEIFICNSVFRLISRCILRISLKYIFPQIKNSIDRVIF